MKAEHLNSFIQGAQDILSTITGERANLGKVFIKQSPFSGLDVAVVIGIVGELSGEVIYTMDEKTGFFLASKLMMGMEVNAIDDMSKSALSELSNMISGTAASVLYETGVTVDITTPSLKIRDELNGYKFSSVASKAVCMPLVFSDGFVFEIDVLLTD